MEFPIIYSNLYMEISASIVKIQSMEIIEEPNEHGKAFLKIMTEEKDELRLINELTTETNVNIVFASDSDSMPTVVFVGMPTHVNIKSIKHVFNVDLELKSKSFAMDLKKKRRSFQNKDCPFSVLFKKVVEENNDYTASVYDVASKGAVQKDSIIQYDETDWEFITRLASKLKAKITTNVRANIISIVIGKQIGSEYIDDSLNFHLTNDAGSFLKAQINYDGWKQEQKVYFEVDSMNDYLLHDKIVYNKILFRVAKKRTAYNDGRIVFTYYLLKEYGIRQDLITNDKILGVSIDGKVIDVRPDRVKLHLSIDKTQSVEEAFWYKFETLYSAEGSTGFYAMPQKGDNVKLYFPKSEWEDGYVKTVNRLDGGSNIKTQNPNVKYYGNIHKKELMLAPSELQVTTTNGMILINMDDKLGIEITSSDNIHITSNPETKIMAKSIALRAKNEILLATKFSSLVIKDEIHLKADGGVSGV